MPIVWIVLYLIIGSFSYTAMDRLGMADHGDSWV